MKLTGDMEGVKWLFGSFHPFSPALVSRTRKPATTSYRRNSVCEPEAGKRALLSGRESGGNGHKVKFV